MGSALRWLASWFWSAPPRRRPVPHCDCQDEVPDEVPQEFRDNGKAPATREYSRHGPLWLTKVGFWWFVMEDGADGGEAVPVERFALMSSAVDFMVEKEVR